LRLHILLIYLIIVSYNYVFSKTSGIIPTLLREKPDYINNKGGTGIMSFLMITVYTKQDSQTKLSKTEKQIISSTIRTVVASHLSETSRSFSFEHIGTIWVKLDYLDNAPDMLIEIPDLMVLGLPMLDELASQLEELYDFMPDKYKILATTISQERQYRQVEIKQE